MLSKVTMLHYLSKTRPALLITFILFLFWQCTNESSDNSGWQKETPRSEEVKLQVNKLLAAIKYYYPTNSDSAIYYSRKIIDLYRKEKMPYNEFDAYIGLSELYNSRKKNGVEALSCYAEALKIMIRHKGNENSYPFFYVDMGNMFYNNKLNTQALINYRKAISIAILNKDTFAHSVGLNNMGITYNAQNKLDSAIYFFRQSLEIRKSMKPQLQAHSYMYLAKAYMSKNESDSALYYRNLALKLMNQQFRLKDPNTSKTIAGDLYINSASVMAAYYRGDKNYRQAIENYDTVQQLSFNSKDYLSAISAGYEMAVLYDSLQNRNKAIQVANVSYLEAVKYQDYDYVTKNSRLLSRLYHKTGDMNKADAFLIIATNYTDSLEQSQRSEEHLSKQMLLIAAQNNQLLADYEIQSKSDHLIIRTLVLWVFILTALFVALSFIVYSIYKRRKLLKLAHIKEAVLAVESFKKIGITIRQPNSESKSAFEQLKIQLEKRMNEDKIYRRQNLTLQEIASMLDTNSTYLSQVINNKLNTNFNDYINSFRIMEACSIFENNTDLKYTIDQVAEMVGFGSRKTFYTVFQKRLGVTPAFFQKNVLNPEVNPQDIDKSSDN